jgi:hypothetical protein
MRLLCHKAVGYCREFNVDLLKPTSYVMHPHNYTLCPHCTDLFCIYLRTNSDLCYLHFKLIGFVTELKSVYSAVRTGPLNQSVFSSSLKS